MNKKYAALIANEINPMGLDPKGQRNLWDSMTKDLEGGQEENKRGVTALKNWVDKASKDQQADIYPSEPGLTETTPDKDLGTAVREGTVAPTELSKELFKTATGMDFPGTGEPTEQEMATQDAWEGFRAADYQGGKAPTQMESAILQEMGGGSKREWMGPEAAPFGKDGGTTQERSFGEDFANDMTFGPSKIIKGLLTGDPETLGQGIKEAQSVAQNIGDVLTGKTGRDQMQKLWDGFEKSMEKEVEKGGPGAQLATDTLGLMKKAKEVNPVEQAIGMISDLVTGKNLGPGSIAQELGNTANLANPANSLMKAWEMTSSILQPGSGKQGKDAPASDLMGNRGGLDLNDEFINDFATKLSSAIAYKKGRKAGLPSKEAGPAAETAGEVTREATRDSKTTDKSAEMIDKGVDAMKAAKNLAVKGASKALAGIPGVGTAAAVALQVANVVVDVVIDASKEMAKDQMGTPGSQAKEGPSGNESPGEPAGQEKSTAEQGVSQAAGAGEMVASNTKQALKKTKGKLLKELLPSGGVGDMVEDSLGGIAKQGASKVTGELKKSDKDRTGQVPEGILEMNQ